VPEIVTWVEAPTALVVMVNVALVEPAGMLTLAGTFAAAVLLLWRVTTTPPAGAAPFKVAVPTEEPPPVTVAGDFESESKDAVLTVRIVLLVAP
jgi:hypothetical protein